MNQSEFLGLFPKGFIVGWFTTANIPAGWSLCDGTNGTPNLVEKFAMGAGHPQELTGIGSSGGSVTHSHTTTDCNGHGASDGYKIDDNRGCCPQCAGLNHWHDVNPGPNIPPYQKIIFIMKTT